MISQAIEQFKKQFHKEPLIVSSPGRINLIGEHTDYNEGFVLPAAIDKKIIYAIALNDTDTCNAYALFNGEKASFSLKDIKPGGGWINYLKGVVYQLQQRGLEVKGFDCVITGDIPIGAGMSSSAAVEGGLNVALNHLLDFKLGRMDMAKVGQLAEHTFPGVKCGIMDQFANLHGQKDRVMLLDCRSLEFTYFPFEFSKEYKIVLVNSMVHHSLASSEYNVRRAQCEEGVKILREFFPDISSLRNLTSAQVEQYKDKLPPKVYDRCRYVTQENERVEKACAHLQRNELKEFGELMYASHEGLSKLYEVSCPELDFLADLAKTRSEVAGARMMGGGFGGCTINLVQTERVEEFTAFMQEQFQQHFGIIPEVYVTSIQEGANVLQPTVAIA
ncbi:galactokinase [Chitinophaga barathri]|uniref:Galactokinase n=1 Tax=Chitinophaga barathri TaxID=1647451 RepID=A0A3N4MF46_9BACT|nr:galactokinase [Chitinophaga barathri]RPD42451.1 galactokinase [Chitinophaga barathri]